MAVLQLRPVQLLITCEALAHACLIVAVQQSHVPGENLVKPRPQASLRWFRAWLLAWLLLRVVACFGFGRPWCH